MRRTHGWVPIVTLALGAVLVSGLQARAPTVRAAAPHYLSGKQCHLTAYANSQTYCVIVPRSGKFYLPVPNTPVLLYGYGNAAAAGHEIDVTKVANPCPNPHAFSFRVLYNGPPGTMPKLYLADQGHGTLYVSTSPGVCTLAPRDSNGVQYVNCTNPPCTYEFVTTPYKLGSSSSKQSVQPGKKKRKKGK